MPDRVLERSAWAPLTVQAQQVSEAMISAP